MNRGIEITLFGAVLCALLLSAGCGKSEKEQYSSPSFMIETITSVIDGMKKVLPGKNPFDVPAAAGRVSSAIADLPTYATSAAGKARAQKAVDMYEKEVNAVVMTLQYDTVTMCKKLDEIRGIVVEIGKEVK